MTDIPSYREKQTHRRTETNKQTDRPIETYRKKKGKGVGQDIFCLLLFG